MMSSSFVINVQVLEEETRCAADAASRAIHRRTQMLCRRGSPRNAFDPQIRAERGTGSALTADADEFGTARAKLQQVVRAQEKRRRISGVRDWKDWLGRLGRQRRFRSGNDPPRLRRLVLLWSVVLCVYWSTVTVCGQFGVGSTSA